MDKTTIEKLINKEKQNKPSWLKELKQIVPHLFKDNEFDKDAFLYELEKDKEEKYKANAANPIKSNEKYGFTWVGKREANDHSILDSINTLSPVKEKSFNFDTSKNIIVEGDNLEVLKILKKSYANKIDVIYIDPPYNTGNDFIYKDKFKISKESYLEKIGNFASNKNESQSELYHTNWLNMIYPRLKVARELLRDDGIIFISIDDNEQARLKLLCDEIFGEHNFVSQLIWRKKNTGGGSDKVTIETETEYILCYGKNKENIKFNRTEIDLSEYKKQDEFYKERGGYKLTDLDRVCSKSSFRYVKSLDYEIKAPDGTYFKNYRNLLKPESYCYTLGEELFNFSLQNGFIEILKTKEGYWKAYRKIYSNVKIDREKMEIVKRDGGNSYNNLILESNITTSNGKRELIKLIDNKDFPFPKPVDLIKHLINFHKKKDILILDFFAGSGTTGHAVMELNKEDDGARNYIMVQIPEKIENSKFSNITEMTIERIKKAIEKYDYKNEGFKYFELNSSNLTELDNSEHQETLFTEIIKRDRTTEQLLTELTLMTGFDLNTKFIRVETDHVAYYIDETQSNMYFLDKTVYDRYLIDEIKKIWDSKKGLGVLNIIVRSDCFSTNDIKMGIIKYINELKKTGNIGIKEI